MKKKYFLYAIVPIISIVAVGTVAAYTVSADSTSGGPAKNSMTNLARVIAQKFNLNVADVQKVFDDQKSQMRTDMEQKIKDRINQAVVDGKITQAQATLILAKMAELKANEATFKASLEGKTQAQVQAAIKAQMDSIKQWAIDNNIPFEYLMMKGGLKGMGAFGKGPRPAK